MEGGSPRRVFLERSKQLNRLQLHILGMMKLETEADREMLSLLKDAPQDARRIVAPGIQRTIERVDDIQLMLQLFLARHVDNFQSFLEDIVRRILETRPEILVKSDAVPMKTILAFKSLGDIENFVAACIDKKLLALGYMSFRSFNAAVEELAQFKLVQGKDAIKQIEDVHDIRNLFTHNYGVVTRHYLLRHPECRTPEGEQLQIGHEYANESWVVFSRAAEDIEKRAGVQFKWSTIR